MQITIQVDKSDNGESKQQQRKCARIRDFLCQLSVTNVLLLTCFLFGLLLILYVCKTYIKTILYWLETQDSKIISLTIILLYTIVALPIALGYIGLVVADGYLFGFVNGLILTVIGSNVGLFIANYILKSIGHHSSIRKMVDNDTSKAIMRVISGPLCFKIVFCSRLTPIPFGLQNTIFALSNISAKVYHLASLFGLLPAQCVAVYVGTTLRSMQDVLENRNISTGTYLFASLQVLLGISLMVWIGAKARTELMKALAEGGNTMSATQKGYNVV